MNKSLQELAVATIVLLRRLYDETKTPLNEPTPGVEILVEEIAFEEFTLLKRIGWHTRLADITEVLCVDPILSVHVAYFTGDPYHFST